VAMTVSVNVYLSHTNPTIRHYITYARDGKSLSRVPGLTPTEIWGGASDLHKNTQVNSIFRTELYKTQITFN
jgi:hypothetical protein